MEIKAEEIFKHIEQHAPETRCITLSQDILLNKLPTNISKSIVIKRNF